MLNEEEKKYLSSTRLSIKVNYVELEDGYKDNNIFYYYGKGLVISTISSETYIDKNYYTDDKLIEILNAIFVCLDAIELVLPEEFFNIDIITKTFFNLNCKTLVVDGDKPIKLEQLKLINEYTEITELKVPEIDKKVGNTKFNFKIIPNIGNKFTSEKFKNFMIDDILRLKALNVDLPLKSDYTDENGEKISEKKDLQKIIDTLVDIDYLTITLLDSGEKSIKQSFTIIKKIEKSIGSKIENIYYVTGNRDIKNVDALKEFEQTHNVAIMYDKEVICSIDDFLVMRKNINKIVKPIEKYEFSPLEKVLFVYDKIKDFYNINSKYIKVKKASRYIHRIFKINDLNCQAYAALLAEILRELNISATDYNLYSPLAEEVFLTKNNHARTMIYLVDDKYKIDGLFSVDVVWDAIKKTKKNYHYEFFLTKISNLKKQYGTDRFNNDIELLLGHKNLSDLTMKEKFVFERLLNKDDITESDIAELREKMKNNISLKIFLYALSAVRVAQGRDKNVIKDELVAIVNRTNKKEKYTDNFYNIKEDLNYLDITLPD